MRKEYYLEHKKEILKKRKIYWKENKEKISIKKKEYYQKNREDLCAKKRQYWKENKKKHQTCMRKYNYGVGKEFDDLLKTQKGLCAICGLPEVVKRKGSIITLSVDHNHNTGKVRGLLCSKCNKALGFLNVDNIGILNLQMAIKYLTETD